MGKCHFGEVNMRPLRANRGFFHRRAEPRRDGDGERRRRHGDAGGPSCEPCQSGTGTMGGTEAEGGVVGDQMHLGGRTGHMDIYTQALKALAVRSPFGTEDANGAGGAASAGGPLVRLPTGETKRKNRARKTQAVSSKRNFGDLESAEANPKLFWAQMEDYFREVTKEDIELLFPRTRLELVDQMLPQDPCFVIRPLGCRYTDVWAEEDRKHRLQVEMEAEAAHEQSLRGVKRKLLTASPVSKKRKTNLVASSTTDVITSVISPPENAGEEMCHVCNGMESYEGNQIVYCDSCNMAAHQECYGIRTLSDAQWLCSWCSAKASGEAVTTGAYCCVLCTVNGGALKPIAEADGTPGQKRFAHLVCCQWIPETYVENTEAVEPIKNIEGIREERWGLVCVICKQKHGACIQCSHGLCATAFHPLCARDAKYWMEVSSREDSQDVELRAYCQKHSCLKPAADISVTLAGDKEKSPEEDPAVDFDDLKCFEDDEPAARVKVEDLPKCAISKAEEWTKEHSSSEELNDGGNDAGEFSARTGPCDSGEVNMEANSGEPGEQTECESASVQPYVLPDILRRLRLLEQNASQRPLSAAGSGDAGEPHKGLEEVLGVGGHWEQLRRAKQSGLLDWSPQDELEAEIYILQSQLINCAQANLCSSQKLIANVLAKLSTERQAARKIVQELTAVSQFISDLKEAKKLGRKERRDKEAQAVLAAATAAAAASPRTGYVKRDTGGNEDPYSDAAADGRSNWLLSNGNQQSPTARPVKPPLPRPPKLNISNSFRVSQLSSRSNSQCQDDGLTCDVCSNNSSVRSNRILQCSRCKVVVHQDCYGVPRLPAGPWYCQPCSEVQQSGAASDAGYAAPQCALCPIKQGALRRASDGRWVHVFCALWIPETTVGKEQTAAIGGLDAVPIERFNLICSVCQHQRGACVKCNFGHCYGAFHPICARDAGLYMSVKTIGGRTNYRAYCERHSSQQRAKADVKQYGSSDEMTALRQIRVEFERVRLICERISKRERIKRDLALCYKDLYITQLNLLALGGASQPVVEQGRKQANGSWYPSSEGVLLEGAADSKLLASEPGAGEAGLWGRRRVFVEQSSNGSKPKEGSQVEVPIRESKDHKKPKRYARHSEPLGREKIMTPSEASMHNKLLPKGYAYVPVDMLEKGIVAVKQEQQQPEQVDKKQELEQSSASSFLLTVVRELQRRTAQSSTASPASPLQHTVGGPSA